MKPEAILRLDPMVHAPTRLAILSVLITVDNANFTFLKESVGTTDGNLSTHLSKLEAGGLIVIRKKFQQKKPQTICAITEKGKKAFIHYLEQLEQIVRMQKKKPQKI